MEYSKLRERIIKALAGELGIYTFSNNTSVPAIAIASNRPYPQPGTNIIGLEVVVYPRISTDASFLLGGTLLEHESRLVLNQWDLTKDTTFAHYLLVANLWDSIQRIGPRILADGSMQTVESQSFYLRESTIINWQR